MSGELPESVKQNKVHVARALKTQHDNMVLVLTVIPLCFSQIAGQFYLVNKFELCINIAKGTP